jgi:hypothetical protein
MLLGTMVFRFVEEIDHQGMSNWNGQIWPLLFTAALFFISSFQCSILEQVCLLLVLVFKVFFFSPVRRD